VTGEVSRDDVVNFLFVRWHVEIIAPK
jgi:hypothetical protein